MGSLQSGAIGMAGRILQFARGAEDSFHVIASEAKQSSFYAEAWIASSLSLLAMTGEGGVTASSHPSEYSSTPHIAVALHISRIQ
jgi:hypothetical protein